MWETVKRRWRENKPWIVAAAILLVGYLTLLVYMNAKADAMARAVLSAGSS